MTPDRWKQIEELFHAARERGVETLSGVDPELRAKVEKLLAGADARHDLLDIPNELITESEVSGLPRLLGPYRLESVVGRGGMGEVYRAVDTRLNRQVAIKVSREQFGERFRREALAIASLNHPNICTLHDIGPDYLVMELVDGKSPEGPLPANEALRIAGQIAAALSAAHEKGIAHRDLKPANIKITSSGLVKVLDFGLAKTVRETAPDDATQFSGLTGEGSVVGTPAYMAPEQVQGKAVDTRADVWAFGVVLYELLTGSPPFRGESVPAVLGAVLAQEPEWVQVPVRARRLLRACLQKAPQERLSDVRDWRLLLDDAETSRPPQRRRASVVPWVVAVAAIALGAFAYFAGVRSVPSAEPMRFSVSMPETVRLASMLTPAGATTAAHSISPDGRNILFSGVDEKTGTMMLYVRPFDSVEARPLPGTEGATFPFWSPNSDAVAFFAERKLKRVAINGGGEPQIVCDAPGALKFEGGGTWNRDDVILAHLVPQGGLSRVSASGGAPAPVTTPSAGESIHLWPQFLPDGSHFLYVVLANNFEDNAIYVGSLHSADRKLVFKGVTTLAAYAHPDQLLFMRDGALMAQAFDTKRLELRGDAVRLVDHVSASPYNNAGGFGLGAFSASETGVIVYRSAARGAPDRFLWIGRDGKEIGPLLPPGYYRDPALSPDGSKLAFTRRESATAASDIYILELATGKETRFTLDPGSDQGPVWSPDGAAILYSSSRKEAPGLYRKNANGVGGEELIYPLKTAFAPYQWPTPDKFLFHLLDELSLHDRKATRLGVQGGGADGAISPDGKWLGYFSLDSAQLEVTTYPPSGTRIVAAPTGADVRWSRNGDVIYYLNYANGELMSVDVTPGNPPRFGLPRRIYAGPLDYNTIHSFDLTPKEDRFIVHTPDPGGEITVLLNWPAAVNKSR
jgi:Tol biopolymer transport system component